MVFGIVVGTYSSIFVALPVIPCSGASIAATQEAQPIRPQGARP